MTGPGNERDAAEKTDPMGVRRRWGVRELVFLAVAAVVLVIGFMVTSRVNPRNPRPGPALGGIPAMGSSNLVK